MFEQSVDQCSTRSFDADFDLCIGVLLFERGDPMRDALGGLFEFAVFDLAVGGDQVVFMGFVCPVNSDKD